MTAQIIEKRLERKRRRSWADYMRANHCRRPDSLKQDNRAPSAKASHDPSGSNDGTTRSALIGRNAGDLHDSLDHRDLVTLTFVW